MKGDEASVIKFHIKMYTLIILPVMLMSIIIPAIVFRQSKVIIETTRKQLKLSEDLIESTVSYLQASPIDEPTLNKVKKNLKQLQEDFNVTVRLNKIEQVSGKRIMVYTISSLILVFSILVVVYLHLLIGPIFRLQRLVVLMASGKDVGQIKIRATDELQQLAKSLEALRLHLLENKKKEEK